MEWFYKVVDFVKWFQWNKNLIPLFLTLNILKNKIADKQSMAVLQYFFIFALKKFIVVNKKRRDVFILSNTF